MARTPLLKCRRAKKDSTEKRRKSLFLKTLAGKRTPAELQHLRLSLGSSSLAGSRSFQSLARSFENVQQPSSPTTSRSSQSPPLARIFSLSDSPNSTANSSPSSSPGSSLPDSPATLGPAGLLGPHFQRPSSLHGLKHKLHHHHHATSKNIHSPNRRKSVGHIPLSPLARTPSPSPISSSPTRSPSPLAVTTNTVSSPGVSFSTTSSLSPASVSAKKPFNRPKNTEPGSPLLRRALSPDRHHPRTTEAKAISPLCNPCYPKVTISSPPKVTITSQTHPSPICKSFPSTTPPSTPSPVPLGKSGSEAPRPGRSRKDGRVEVENDIVKTSLSSSESTNSTSSLSSVSIGLPRIAEEKDSPKEDHHSGESLALKCIESCRMERHPAPEQFRDRQNRGDSINLISGANLSSINNSSNKDKPQKVEEKPKSASGTKQPPTSTGSSSSSKGSSTVPVVPTVKDSSKKKESPLGWLKSKSDKKSSP